jgi:hypothetical protein
MDNHPTPRAEPTPVANHLPVLLALDRFADRLRHRRAAKATGREVASDSRPAA